ncbi:hypothetical protein H2O64_15725 [Kordia sp. YSTF-M3]|uniref:Uncharacterized protein n=1 Tax=Kordia aestuariivivens TaxID=2759037 RepID=A0ABR7QC36_9FLAO|nr:hypothetical protein [Kordia aestuariivivens]MBC8756125.1 hypothetical protein [Kordia aestuariivivens]
MKTSFLHTFWVQLDLRLSEEFSKSEDPLLKNFWCDGIYLYPTDHQLVKKYVNDKRKIVVTAWLGKTGQDAYEATIHFGTRALSRYAKGTDVSEAIPKFESQTEWIEIDIERKTIEIRLD